MYILAFETTGNYGSVALIAGDGYIWQKMTTERMSHLKMITQEAERVLEEAGVKKDEITAVAASVGPGSFTGIRIGLATARTIGQALGIPCIGVSSLEIFREKAEEGRSAAVIFNARRGQVYGAVFDEDGSEVLKPGPYMLEQVMEVSEKVKNPENLVWYGDGTDAYAYRLEGRKIASEEDRYQMADMVARKALEEYRKGNTVTYNELLPDYMRVAEAEQKLKDGTLAKMRAAKLERLKNNGRTGN